MSVWHNKYLHVSSLRFRLTHPVFRLVRNDEQCSKLRLEAHLAILREVPRASVQGRDGRGRRGSRGGLGGGERGRMSCARLGGGGRRR